MSELTFIIGGARSGKSAFAMKLAKKYKHVCYIATADSGQASQIDDGEMLERIQKHRKNRPADWKTVEAPLGLDKAVSNFNGEMDVVLIDCITMYVTNMLLGGSKEAGDEYIIDAINKYADLAPKKSQIKIDFENFILMTLHRAENVDDKNILSSIIKAISHSKENIIFPIHPHTLKKLHDFKLYSKLKDSNNVHMIPPVGYFDMLELMKKCSFIITDSGGIQQEATSPKIRKRVLVTRKTTDSPEAVLAGVAKVVGINSSKISAAIKETINTITRYEI